jgi:hypothetical protein
LLLRKDTTEAPYLLPLFHRDTLIFGRGPSGSFGSIGPLAGSYPRLFFGF